jgi:hypothetical protein
MNENNIHAGGSVASPVDGGIASEGESITLPEVTGTGIRGLAR